MLLWSPLAAQPIRHIPNEPMCTDCFIELTSVVELGDTQGGGMIDWYGGRSLAAVDSHGLLYVRGFSGTEVKVYSSGGEYRTTIGGKGEGPGEFRTVMGLAVGSADSLYVFDQRAMRMSVFSADHEFARSARLDITPSGVDPLVLSWDRGHFYMTSHMRTPALIGWPIHRIDAEGSRTASFGSRTGEYLPSQPYSGMRIIAAAGEGALWSGRVAHYWLERLSTDSFIPLEEIRREADWFPVPSPADLQTDHGNGRPPPVMTAVYQQGDLLWVLTWATDPKWETAGSELEDEHERYDSVIEVIDLTEGRVVARSRFDELYDQFLGPQLVGGTVMRGGYIPVYRIMRMAIQRRQARQGNRTSGGPY